MTISCDYCGAENKWNSQFCSECTAPIRQNISHRCVYCGKKIINSYKICNGCGADIKLSRNSGIFYGIKANVNTFADNIKFKSSQGHGFAAESANHLIDKCLLKDAFHIGQNNIKDGADRIVHGKYIQSKYCRSGKECINNCFDKNSNWRYFNPDGKPMQIEVPKDKYPEALRTLEDKIKRGRVPGIKNPEESENIVLKGFFTYEQAKNIAKFGTIESLSYDTVNGFPKSLSAMGISATISFAHALWSGEDINKALERACYVGLEVGGITLLTGIASSQISRTSFEKSLRPVTDFIAKKISANVLMKKVLGNNASKLLRGNIVTGLITTTILSTKDVCRLINRKISPEQTFKNITTTAASVGGGVVGAETGARVGAAIGSILPRLCKALHNKGYVQ